MPIYEYQCPECLALTEEFLSISQSDKEFYCTDDNALMIKQMGSPPGKVIGSKNPCTGRIRRGY